MRKRMSKRASRANFRRVATRVRRRNLRKRLSRGGYML